MKKRLPVSVFKIPTDKLRCGYYTDRYFLRTRDILERDKQNPRISFQFFVRDHGVVCGLDEALAILKTCAGYYQNPNQAGKLYKELRLVQWKYQEASALGRQSLILKWQRRRAEVRKQLNRLWVYGWKDLKVQSLYDGDRVREGEVVLAVEGNPALFVHLETVLLGVIARPTATATAVSRVVKAAHGKPILFFSARFDHYWVQTSDGYAALKAGAFAASTDANTDYWGTESMGTMPHFMVGCYEGDTVKSFLSFDRYTDSRVNRIALVDWDNDCIGTTRKILEGLVARKTAGLIAERDFLRHSAGVVGAGKGKLWGVRFDTSGSMRDRSVRPRGQKGVCPELVLKARKAFDEWGCQKLKIVVSGGFDERRIREFERRRIPADAYGVGSSLLRHRIDLTADIVECNGRPCAKKGRKKKDWSRLHLIA